MLHSTDCDLCAYAEAVLFVLLQHFKFEPTGKPIAWNLAAVQYPTVGKESPVPELPLKVTALRS